ncbi:hypothetical protein ACJMK2_010740 [Sinanodonta woodiana]|uniref:Transmembrane protein n=1 Tax=Sinanodonta woodiana TaxID=1069815 RepID=A0ABD3VGC7_SINWO
MVIPLGNYHRCCSGVPSMVVTRSMARKLVSEMQIQDLTVGDETLVDVAPLSDLPDPLSESSVSFGMPADLEETLIGKEKVCLEPLQSSIFQAIELVSVNACVVCVFFPFVLLCPILCFSCFIFCVNACVVFVFFLVFVLFPFVLLCPILCLLGFIFHFRMRSRAGRVFFARIFVPVFARIFVSVFARIFVSVLALIFVYVFARF